MSDAPPVAIKPQWECSNTDSSGSSSGIGNSNGSSSSSTSTSSSSSSRSSNTAQRFFYIASASLNGRNERNRHLFRNYTVSTMRVSSQQEKSNFVGNAYKR
uniref:Uncharacterized protein n=1 Tax=Vespula pensylvanica TaxID=30213 RepID=A0A834UCN5_VESPE|nr:hypothetical protein H0235_004190 [Vespula pensylvanica]